MDTFKISVYVPMNLAVRTGIGRFGNAEFQPTDEQLAELTPEERLFLMQYEHKTGRCRMDLIGPQVDWSTIVATLRKQIAERAEKDAEEMRVREKRIVDALAAPDIDFVGVEAYYGAAHYVEDQRRKYRPKMRPKNQPVAGFYFNDDEAGDPRIVARREQIERDLLPELVAEWEAKAAQYEAEEAHKKAEHAARVERYAEICRAYVRQHVSDYARAATEGCNVNAPAERHVSDVLDERLLRVQRKFWPSTDQPCELLFSLWKYSTQHMRTDDDQEAPHAHTYAVFDAVRNELTAHELPMLIESAETAIVKINTCPTRSCTGGRRTAVRVDFLWKDGERSTIYVYADHAKPHVHDADNADDS